MENTHYLNIDNCILFHDVKQIKKEPAAAKIRTRNKLAKLLLKKELLDGTYISVYTKLYRLENQGFSKPVDEIIAALLTVLEVDRDELVKEFKNS